MNLDIIKSTLNQDKVVYWQDCLPNTPNWGDFVNFIDFINSQSYDSAYIRNEKVSIHNDLLYLRIADAVDAKTGKNMNDLFPELDTLIDIFDQVFEENCKFGECYINLSTPSRILQPHNDPWAAISWQCIGSVEWRIFPDYHDETKWDTYILNPGDLIVVPKYMKHLVIPKGPRASLTITYNPDIDRK
jgi:hypothetical protein